MTKAEMNHGVRILIDRMQTNPEDFAYGGRFWYLTDSLTDAVKNPGERDHFFAHSEEDRAALLDAWKQYLCSNFSAEVMKRLTEDATVEEGLLVSGKSVKTKLPNVTKVTPTMQQEMQRMMVEQQQQMQHEHMVAHAEQQRQYYNQRLRNSISGLSSDLQSSPWNPLK